MSDNLLTSCTVKIGTGLSTVTGEEEFDPASEGTIDTGNGSVVLDLRDDIDFLSLENASPGISNGPSMGESNSATESSLTSGDSSSCIHACSLPSSATGVAPNGNSSICISICAVGIASNKPSVQPPSTYAIGEPSIEDTSTMRFDFVTESRSDDRMSNSKSEFSRRSTGAEVR